MAAIDYIVVTENRGVKSAAVPALEVIAEYYSDRLPDKARAFSALLEDLQAYSVDLFRQKDPKLKKPSGPAFNNCNGKWSEYIFAVFAWNALAAMNIADPDSNYVYVKLPNNKSSNTNWISLLVADQLSELQRFERGEDDPLVVGSGHKALRLCSSNPDALILKYPKDMDLGLPCSPEEELSDISLATLTALDQIFSRLRGKLNIKENLVAFLSMKTSIRPDRRYQFVHEGDSIKAILMYLCTNDHLRLGLGQSFLRNKFYGFSLSSTTEADHFAMDTAMTACISSPGMEKLWSVDKLCACPHPSDVELEIASILEP